MKLNLGAGSDIKKGFINTDIIKFKGIDQIMDINKKFPFPSNHFNEILCFKILEYSTDLQHSISELYRVAKNNCTIEITTPHHKSDGAFRNIRPITKDVAENYLPKDSFKILNVKCACKGKLRKLIPFKKFFSIFLWNIYDELYLKVEILKKENGRTK
jgi:ubiquinone/menaquinone biosynthesis C-methylase UbiE